MRFRMWMRGAAFAAVGMFAVGAGLGLYSLEGHAVAAAAGLPASARAAAAGDQPIFVTHCFYSHTLPDDPIVHPNMPGASHQHDFFGNDSTNASSTLDSMEQGGST